VYIVSDSAGAARFDIAAILLKLAHQGAAPTRGAESDIYTVALFSILKTCCSTCMAWPLFTRWRKRLQMARAHSQYKTRRWGTEQWWAYMLLFAYTLVACRLTALAYVTAGIATAVYVWLLYLLDCVNKVTVRFPDRTYTQGEKTSQNLWSRYVRHFVGITWHNVWS